MERGYINYDEGERLVRIGAVTSLAIRAAFPMVLAMIVEDYFMARDDSDAGAAKAGLYEMCNTWLYYRPPTPRMIELACSRGHVEIVRAMIERWPNAIPWLNAARGACRSGIPELEVMTMLPPGVTGDMATYWWYYSLEGACRGGHLDLVRMKWAAVHDELYSKCMYPWYERIMIAACYSGSLDVIRLIDMAGWDCAPPLDIRLADRCMVAACHHGHLHVVKYIFNRVGGGTDIYELQLVSGVSAAISCGHDDLARWIMHMEDRTYTKAAIEQSIEYIRSNRIHYKNDWKLPKYDLRRSSRADELNHSV